MGGRTERVGGITGGVKVLGSACRRFRLEMFVPGGCGLGQGEWAGRVANVPTREGSESKMNQM